MLLEEVEAKFESVEQNLLRVLSHHSLEECLLGALSSRALRQHGMVEELVFRYMGCNNNRAEAWATLVEKSNAFSSPII